MTNSTRHDTGFITAVTTLFVALLLASCSEMAFATPAQTLADLQARGVTEVGGSSKYAHYLPRLGAGGTLPSSMIDFGSEGPMSQWSLFPAVSAVRLQKWPLVLGEGDGTNATFSVSSDNQRLSFRCGSDVVMQIASPGQAGGGVVTNAYMDISNLSTAQFTTLSESGYYGVPYPDLYYRRTGEVSWERVPSQSTVVAQVILGGAVREAYVTTANLLSAGITVNNVNNYEFDVHSELSGIPQLQLAAEAFKLGPRQIGVTNINVLGMHYDVLADKDTVRYDGPVDIHAKDIQARDIDATNIVAWKVESPVQTNDLTSWGIGYNQGARMSYARAGQGRFDSLRVGSDYGKTNLFITGEAKVEGGVFALDVHASWAGFDQMRVDDFASIVSLSAVTGQVSYLQANDLIGNMAYIHALRSDSMETAQIFSPGGTGTLSVSAPHIALNADVVTFTNDVCVAGASALVGPVSVSNRLVSTYFNAHGAVDSPERRAGAAIITRDLTATNIYAKTVYADNIVTSDTDGDFGHVTAREYVETPLITATNVTADMYVIRGHRRRAELTLDENGDVVCELFEE